jgi:SAM-dependent methyltransferase
MKMDNYILETWHQNAEPWIRAVSEQAIESRNLVTNTAITMAVASLYPTRVWDIGCGEGWLCRRLSSMGMECVGTDAIPDLIDEASRRGGGYFEVLPYEDITTEIASSFVADACVFNFSLFGYDGTEKMLSTLHDALPEDGHLVIQTLHPYAAMGDEIYISGWRQGSWIGFSEDFVNPAPWYYRTIGDWVKLLVGCGYRIIRIEEPMHPETGMPVSLILTAAKY